MQRDSRHLRLMSRQGTELAERLCEPHEVKNGSKHNGEEEDHLKELRKIMQAVLTVQG